MRIQTTVATISLCVFLSACVGGNTGISKQTTGAFIGGAAGGAACSNVGKGRGNTVAIIGCTLLGAVIGGAVGQSMDEQDRMQTQQVLESAPTGQARSWVNPDNGNQYSVTPTNTYNQGGQPCREFSTEAYIDGRREVVYGRACRRSDGNWEMAS